MGGYICVMDDDGFIFHFVVDIKAIQKLCELNLMFFGK